MKILVTGGAGYVGSHCVRTLCDAGHEVVVLDNLVNGGHREAVDERADLIVGDLGDDALVDHTLRVGQYGGVLHFAALLNVNESVTHPLRYYRNNVVNTVGLLEKMQAYDVQRLVFSSSCAVYGVPPAVPITEEMPREPISPYGCTKLAIEWVLRDAAAAWGLGATALRYFNASGAALDGTIGEDRDPEYHLIPVTLQVALGQRAEIKVFGSDYETPDGTCVRDYIHVEDLAHVHRLAIETQQPGQFRYYNVGTGSGVSVMELIEAARRVTGHPIPVTPADRREGDPPALFADPSKIADELGWRPRHTDIQKTIESAWNWHKSHPSGYVDTPRA